VQVNAGMCWRERRGRGAVGGVAKSAALITIDDLGALHTIKR